MSRASVKVDLQYVEDDLRARLNPTKIRDPLTTDDYIFDTYSVTTTAADLDLSSLTTPKEVAIKNLDDTNFIKVGKNVTGSLELMCELQPGEACLFILPSAGLTIRWQADTGTCKAAVLAIET